jgi:hypothetical protein
VLFVQRDIGKVLEFLNIDTTRPAYSEQIEGVWLKRKPWYQDCSNHQYYVQHTETKARSTDLEDLSRFLKQISGSSRAFDLIQRKRHTFFVSMTIPEVAPAVGLMKEVTVGSDAVELRVDLLEDPQNRGVIPPIDYVTEQLALLRSVVSVPLIFTVRTRSQGADFPTTHTLKLLICIGSRYVWVSSSWIWNFNFPWSYYKPSRTTRGFQNNCLPSRSAGPSFLEQRILDPLLQQSPTVRGYRQTGWSCT